MVYDEWGRLTNVGIIGTPVPVIQKPNSPFSSSERLRVGAIAGMEPMPASLFSRSIGALTQFFESRIGASLIISVFVEGK